MEIEGKIVQILPEQKGTSSRGEWQKQDFILETQDQYPKKVCISVWNNKFEVEPLLNTSVRVSINIESREYNQRWYTDVKAWKVEALSDVGGSPETSPPQNMEEGPDMSVNPDDEEMDDLPF